MTDTVIVCAICGEESGGKGTSLYGYCHKYGPTTHHFTPREKTLADQTAESMRGLARDVKE